MTARRTAPDWGAMLRSWDAQQESFNPLRERRFTVMLEILGATVGSRFTALDLGSGPGSLSARLLGRFPAARAIAVDYDPVSLAVGEGALGNQGGRLTWVDAKLGAPGWTDRLPRRRIDAAVSTTALHWLTPPRLRSLYRDLAKILPRGGVFLNGDYLAYGARTPGLRRLAARVYRHRTRGIPPGKEWSAWTEWWERAEKVPALRPYFAERTRRASYHPKHETTSLDLHEEALRRAGFREVAVLWQDIENRILFAQR